MRSGIFIAVILSIIGFGAENVNYDAVRQGQLPPGWSAPPNHKWEVHADKTAPSHPNVLQSSSAAGETGGPPVLFDKVICRDGDVSVKFRIDGSGGGNEAGLVWRYQDPNDYYLLTLNADDNRIVLRRVRNGVSEVLSTSRGRAAGVGVEQDIRAGQWHVVKVRFRGPKVQVFYGNRSIFTAEDTGLPVAGKTGLWAKGPTGAVFDDFRIDKKA